jgi:hypothetical protein
MFKLARLNPFAAKPARAPVSEPRRNPDPIFTDEWKRLCEAEHKAKS